MGKEVIDKSEMLSVRKKDDFLKWFREVIKFADMVDTRYGAKGFVVRKPWTMITTNIMYRMFDEEFCKYDHYPAMFPSVIPESNLSKEEEHVKGFSAEVFWITESGSNNTKFEERLALKPTGETAIYPMYAKWIRSYQDLPIKYYQSGTVFRCETKETRPFLREREFMWIEAHCAFATEKEAWEQTKVDQKITKAMLWDKMGLPFMIYKRPQWDKFAGAVDTFGCDVLLVNGRVNQVGSTHMLGTNFAKVFDIKYTDVDEKKKYVYQTCYGPGFSRIIASIICVHGDDKGLVYPFDLAPLQIVIVPIIFKGKEEIVMKSCENLCDKLKSKGFRVKIDSTDRSAGAKFYEWELKGVPLRIEIGPRDIENKQVVIVRRDTGEKSFVAEADILKTISSVEPEILVNLKKKAVDNVKGLIVDCSKFDDLKKSIVGGKIVRCGFCSIEMDGEKCADKIKDACGAEVRGTNEEKSEKVGKGVKCIVCGKDAKHVVYVARDY